METTATASSSNGWHRVEDGRWEITWRTQRPTCHQTLVPFDGDNRPFYPDNGRFRSYVRQCGGCGSQFAGEFYVRRI